VAPHNWQAEIDRKPLPGFDFCRFSSKHGPTRVISRTNIPFPPRPLSAAGANPPSGRSKHRRAGTPAHSLPTHLAELLDRRWNRYRRQYKRCQKHCSEKSVHQLRVETRRVLALLDLLEVALPSSALDFARKGLKSLFKKFSKLRDTHVQGNAVHQHLPLFPEAAPFNSWLAKQEKRLVDRASTEIKRAKLRKVKKAIETVQTDLLDLTRRGSESDLAAKKLIAAAAQAYQEAHTLKVRIDPADSQTIHRTRVAFKNFRYTVELLRPVLPGATPGRLKAMQAYQTLMGRVQDVEVLTATFDRFCKRHPKKTRTIQIYRHHLECERAARISDYLLHRDRLDRFWPLDQPATPGRKERPRPTRVREQS